MITTIWRSSLQPLFRVIYNNSLQWLLPLFRVTTMMNYSFTISRLPPFQSQQFIVAWTPQLHHYAALRPRLVGHQLHPQLTPQRHRIERTRLVRPARGLSRKGGDAMVVGEWLVNMVGWCWLVTTWLVLSDASWWFCGWIGYYNCFPSVMMVGGWFLLILGSILTRAKNSKLQAPKCHDFPTSSRRISRRSWCWWGLFQIADRSTSC